jgi:uncharacterized protein YjiS (DUF1127 family)
MSCADKTSSTLNAVAAPVPLWIWPSLPAALWQRFCHALELRRQRRALRDLDDRQLADIGVTREQALREANQLFWTRV